MLLSINPKHPEPRKIHRVVDILQKGGVVCYPTDTAYGLGCDILNKRAIERIYKIKSMPSDHLLSFVCPDLSDIAHYAFVDDVAYRTMRRLVPGPYTFVLKATREVPKRLMMKRKTVGIRVPDHPVALALVRELNRPIVSSSATLGDETFIDPAEIDERFSGLDLVLDCDTCGITPSTIIDLSGPEPTVIRQGAGPVDFI